MQIELEDGPVDTGIVGGVQPLIQNLGPGLLFIGRNPNALLTEGVLLQPGDAYEFPDVLGQSGGRLFAQAVNFECDVRVLSV